MRNTPRTVSRLIVLLTLVGAAACTDELPVTSPSALTGDENPDPAGNRSVIASVNCTADVATATLSCGEVPVVDAETGLQRVTLGGQNLYVVLVSSAASYNPSTQIFQANVQVANLIQQGLGSPDGLTTTGIRVFHHSGPTVTSGTGTVTVANADGTGAFTGSNQPYHFYGYYIPYFYITPAKTWQWNVPTTATTFAFTVFVDADVVGENGYIEMNPSSVLLQTVGATTTVAGTPMDVVGRSVSGTVTYTSSDPSIATVDLNSGFVTAVSSGVVDIIASTGGPEIDGITRVTVAPPAGAFDINFEFLTAATPAEQLAFTNAAARWAGLIVGDLPTELVDLPFIACGGVIDEYVDDLTIRVVIAPIDGPGNILGQAAPCWIRSGSGLPAFGIMQFDSDDTGFPGFADVVLHEMGHVLGIGTLWDLVPEFGLLSDSTGVLDHCPAAPKDPYFSGAQAIAAFNNIGGSGYTDYKVPAEDLYGDGTRCVHWRESVLDTELMTGYAESGTMPLSELTVKSLADMGYTVATSGWDSFTCPFCAPPAPGVAAVDTRAGGFELVDDVLRLPLFTRDASGRVIQVRQGNVEALRIGN
jgi:hypothetical protein